MFGDHFNYIFSILPLSLWFVRPRFPACNFIFKIGFAKSFKANMLRFFFQFLLLIKCLSA